MTSISREVVRDDLVTKLRATDTFKTKTGQVFSYLATDFQGMTPCCTVETYGSKLDTENEGDELQVNFVVGMWVKRDESTAAAAEDTLDTLEVELRDVLRKNYNGRYARESQAMYDVIAGEDYRIEFHFVQIDW